MAKINVIQTKCKNILKRKRVAAYARVSMETEQLLHSLSAQVSHYSRLIQNNPEWEYVGAYVDQGITGRSTVHRDEFNRLMSDCDAGKVDLILVKSISRFARDTVDCLNSIRHLKEIGVEVRFEREGISTLSADGELLLTLLASFAQAESDSLSTNIKWATRKRFEQGIPNGHKETYGYRWDGEKYRVIPEQGEVVKEIFRRYLSGESGYSIAKMLKKRGVLGNKGLPMDDSTVKDIVTNISYTGTMLLQKHYFTEGHIRKLNKGELPRYAVEDIFEPLISFEEYERALAIRHYRADNAPNRNPQLTKFSGLMKCGNCGCGLSRRTWSSKKKWVCNTKERKGMSVCDMPTISESELEIMSRAVAGDVDDETFRRKVDKIVVYGGSVEFHLVNGKVKMIARKYGKDKDRTVFSGKLFCGNCGARLIRKTGIRRTNGVCTKLKSWVCMSKKCNNPVRSLIEDDIKLASTNVLGGAEYESAFVEKVKRALVFDKHVEFLLKEGTVKIWQRK